MKHTLLIISLLFSLGGFAQSNINTHPHTTTAQTTDPNGLNTGVNPATPAPQQKQIFVYVEQMPAAAYDMNAYIAKNIHYPDSAKAHGTMGRVIINFVVNEDGSISDCNVVRGIGDGCDEEAKRVICNMPKWKPGKQNGKAVAVRFTTPVTFSLQ